VFLRNTNFYLFNLIIVNIIYITLNNLSFFKNIDHFIKLLSQIIIILISMYQKNGRSLKTGLWE
jgi:hypothetical protein